MRELKTVTAASGTTWTKTAWAGSELALELDSDGTSYTYLWGLGRIPLSVTEKTAAGVSTTFAYQVDAMGSVIGMTDASGAVVACYAYDPWGNPISATGTAAIATRNPLRYRAYYTDAETGLCYMPARYYDPETARFLSVDPAAPSAGDPGSLNSLFYADSNPVMFVDPDGRDILYGNYYSEDQSQYEPDIPQKHGNYNPALVEKSSGQLERQRDEAARKRAQEAAARRYADMTAQLGGDEAIIAFGDKYVETYRVGVLWLVLGRNDYSARLGSYTAVAGHSNGGGLSYSLAPGSYNHSVSQGWPKLGFDRDGTTFGGLTHFKGYQGFGVHDNGFSRGITASPDISINFFYFNAGAPGSFCP